MSTSEYLRTLPAIRERCSKVFALGQQGKLEYFNYHADKEPDVIDYCTNIIKVSAPQKVEANTWFESLTKVVVPA